MGKKWKGSMEVGHGGNNIHTKTHKHISGRPVRFIKRGSRVVCQHTCSFWANAVGLVSARSGSRYCRGSSHSDSLSNRGMAGAGAGDSTGPWLGGYRGTGRSRQRAGRRAGSQHGKASAECLSGSIGSWVTEFKLGAWCGRLAMCYQWRGFNENHYD